MGAQRRLDREELSRSDMKQNRRARARKTRAQRLAELLETPEGRAAYASNLAAAAETYDAVIAMDAGFAPAYRGLGEVYEQLGRHRDAAQAYLTYVKTAPDAADRPIVVGRLRELTAKLKESG